MANKAQAQETQTFYAVLNPELDKAGYGFSVPILAVDRENNEETEFMAGVPREVTQEEYDQLGGTLDGKKIVVKA